MAAPTPTARATPSGIRIDDGFRTLITFARDTNLEIWEKSVTPPGLDGGDAVETTNMHNVIYRTMSPRKLKTMTESQVKAAYDPLIYTAARELINVEDTITVKFPDGSTLAYYGYLKGIEADELVEGTQPEMTLTVVATNQDPVTGAEESAVFTNVSGT